MPIQKIRITKVEFMNFNMLMPLLLIVVFVFFIILPQRREKKEFEKMLAALKKGDKVLTNSGIYGEVVNLIDDQKVTLKVADNVKIDFAKSTISKVLK